MGRRARWDCGFGEGERQATLTHAHGSKLGVLMEFTFFLKKLWREKMTKIINVASLMTSREKNLRRRLATVNCKRKTPQLKFS
jgi:hypothetical protein